jgi:hypothetical protein
MSVPALVSDLRARGVHLAAEGERLVARGRKLPPDLADRLRAVKPAVLALLAAEPIDPTTAVTLRQRYAELSQPERERLESDAVAGDGLAATILAAVATPTPCAWLLHSSRLGCAVWLLRDRAADAVLTEADRATPVVYGDELPALRTLDTNTLRTTLDAKQAFGSGTRVAGGEA